MTPKIIELKQAPVVLVELPEGAICPSIGLSVLGYFFEGRIIIDSRIKGKYEVEGFLYKLTEEQFAKCVMVFHKTNEDIAYANYIMGTGGYSAKDFFNLLLESENVYTENPHYMPLVIDESLWDSSEQDSQVYAQYQHDLDKWQEAQQRTIDPKRTVVLLRKEDVK